MAKNININNLLCFLATASNDYAQNIVFDLIYSFYSIDQIIESKDLLAVLLKKEVVNRRTPDKKRKDLEDVIEYFNELKQSSRATKEIFVADSYKKLPPVGMEFIAPILANLSEEVSKLNNILPKISDIKTEVVNTADTVRSLKIDVNAIQKALPTISSSNIISKPPTRDNNNIMTFRNNNSNEDSHKSVFASRESVDVDSVKVTQHNSFSPQPPHVISNKIVNLQNQILSNTGKNLDLNSTPRLKASAGGQITNSNNTVTHSTNLNHETREDFPGSLEDDWSLKRSRNSIRRDILRRRRSSNIVTGNKKSNSDDFKSAERFVDVFIGRVEKSVNSEIISNYISDNFEIKCVGIEKLETKTDQYNCFKVNVNIHDREKLFKPELWPEGIVIKKYYIRKKK